MIEVKNLQKTYKPKKGKAVEALKGINLKFEETGLVFILGKSGSGKSTLLNMLGGLDKFDEGEIIIKGKSSCDFSQSDFDSYRNTFIGFIFQEYNILNDFTVGANIALAMELQGKKADKEALNNILNEVDLEGYAHRKPNELSGGQKQRVAIARALIKNPEIIMADEPTGALDSNTGKQVFDTLKKLSKDKLVIVVSHDREFAEQYGDRVIELSDGEVISDIKKYLAKPSNISEGIDIIEDKIIHIKSGYELTADDLTKINEYLRNNKDADSFISIDSRTNEQIKRAVRIDESGNRENFSDTNDTNLDIKEYDPKRFKLIRSKLPLKNSLKIAFGSLKKKPFRLIMTIILSTVAFTLFGLVNTMSSYDSVNAGTDSIIDSNVDYAAFIRQDYVDYGDGYGYYYHSMLSDKDVEAIEKKFPDMKFNKYIQSDFINLSASENIFDNEKISFMNGISYYSTSFSGITTITDEIIKDMGYTLEGKLPSKDNEIVISDYMAETFIKAGYKGEAYQEKATAINSPKDMIGKTLAIPFKDGKYTVVGVLDTNYDSERYAAYKEEIKGNPSLKDYVMSSEMYDVNLYSYHTALFTTQNIYDEFLSTIKGVYLYMVSSNISFSSQKSDEYLYYDVSHAIEYDELDEEMKANTIIFDEKTTLEEDEVILPVSSLLNNYDYASDFLGNSDINICKDIAEMHKAEITSIPLTVEKYDYADYNNTKTYNLKVVGLYMDFLDPYGISYAILPEGSYKKLNLKADGKYTALLSKMPENQEAVETLVKYSEDSANELETAKYSLINCTTYTIDMVNEAISSSKKVLLYIGIFFAIFASIMLMNFITTSISYRKREIGILRAVGARGTDVFKIFFNESLIIAAINWLASCIVTGLIVFVINSVCRNDLNLVVTILHFGALQLALMLIISVAVAFIASFFPVYRVSRRRPVEAIRNS